MRIRTTCLVMWCNACFPRPNPDNFPILLEVGRVLIRGPSHFRFENMWLKEESFKDLIRDCWLSLIVRGFSSFILAQKLKALKAFLKVWNKEVFGKVETVIVL